MLSKFKLATKFTLLLSLVFIGTILISSLILSKALEYKAEAEISYRGQVLLQMVDSVRDYTNARITPLLEPQWEAERNFLPESIPSFAAREVFEGLRKNKEYKNLYFKDATLNPTNLADKADEFETELIERFRHEPETQTISGYQNLFGEQLFYSAYPFKVTNSSCLRCHSTPAAAPKSHLTTYGAENGFGWKLDEILGVKIIYVPAQKVLDSARRAFHLVIEIFLGIFTLVILLINYLLKQNVIQPIKPLAQLAQKLSTNTVSSDEAKEFELKGIAAIAKRTDELGHLGRVFQRMVQEISVREQRLRQQVQELRIEIDQTKRARQVAEIAETESFQNLRREAKDIRNQWNTE